GLQPVDRQVAVRLLVLGEPRLGGADALQQRHGAVLVHVDADPEVDLAGPVVGLERLGQAEDRVTRGTFDALQHPHVPKPARPGRTIPRRDPAPRSPSLTHTLPAHAYAAAAAWGNDVCVSVRCGAGASAILDGS